MKRLVEGTDRRQTMLLPDCVDDYVAEDNPVRAVEAFVDALDLAALGFAGAVPKATGRPAYHPATLLKLYIYGYLNRIPSSRRLEREAQRNLELLWLTRQLAPDFKTIADFRKDNGPAIRATCRQFVLLCRKLGLLTDAVVAVDGSKFKAVNNRDKNFTPYKLGKRIEQVETSIERYLAAIEAADRHEGDEVLQAKSARLKEKIAALRERVQRLRDLEPQLQAAPDQQLSLTDPDAGSRHRAEAGITLSGTYQEHRQQLVLEALVQQARGCGAAFVQPPNSATARLTAGRADVAANQRSTCGASLKSTSAKPRRQIQPKVAMSAIEYSAPASHSASASLPSSTRMLRFASVWKRSIAGGIFSGASFRK